MKDLSGKWWLGLAAAILCFAPSSLADTSIVLTGAGNNPVDGVYVGPYQGTVNGVANTQVICDDFGDESYVPESWSATSTVDAGLPAASPVNFFAVDGQQGYSAVASLAEQLFALSPSDPNYDTKAADLQYAIWYVFDKSGVTSFLSGDSTLLNAASADAAAALGGSYTPGEFSNIEILTPDTTQPISCNGGPCANTPPQEFIVQTPEPGTFAMLGIGLLMVGLLARRKYSVASSVASA